MSQHLEALKLSISIAQFAIKERHNELTNNPEHINFRRVDYVNPCTVTIEDWEYMHEVHWDTYFKASDSYILSLNSKSTI